jgi:hypothetical protein
MKHSFDDILKAFEFVSSAPLEENQAILNVSTGEILYKSGMLDEEEFPEEVETSDDYVWIPHREDFDLGAGLVIDFAELHLPHEMKNVKRMFKRKDAMTNFLSLLKYHGRLDDWLAFEKEKTRTVLLEWCEENEIEVEQDRNYESSS